MYIQLVQYQVEMLASTCKFEVLGTIVFIMSCHSEVDIKYITPKNNCYHYPHKNMCFGAYKKRPRRFFYASTTYVIKNRLNRS